VTVTIGTVTLNDPDAELPALSFAEQDTVVVPNGNVEPEAGVQVTVTEPSTRSVAEAENFTTAPLELVAGAVISAGSCNFGGVLSTTVTLNEAEAVFPALSVTEHDTVVEPNANVEPDEGVQVGANGPSTRSEAEAVYVTTAPLGPVAFTVMSAGTVTTGEYRVLYVAVNAVGAFIGPGGEAFWSRHCALPSPEMIVDGNTPTAEPPALTHSVAGIETVRLQPVCEYVT
jgi:hypothetical protein